MMDGAPPAAAASAQRGLRPGYRGPRAAPAAALTRTAPPRTPASAPAKPLLRGVSHQIAFFCAALATVVLIPKARTGAATLAVSVFGASLTILFGTSALYHRGDWSPRARGWLKRLDQTAIYLSMAGGYTPLIALVSSSTGGHVALWILWIGAAFGALKSLAWPSAPKRVNSLCYAAYGWAIVGAVLDRAPAVGPLCIGLLAASGIIYSAGAIVYATERPNPLPRVFGYHEVFHALIVVGTVCLFGHVAVLMRIH